MAYFFRCELLLQGWASNIIESSLIELNPSFYQVTSVQGGWFQLDKHVEYQANEEKSTAHMGPNIHCLIVKHK